MRISDWRSDVCSSDLLFLSLSKERAGPTAVPLASCFDRLSIEANTGSRGTMKFRASPAVIGFLDRGDVQLDHAQHRLEGIGRASWRERGCQYVLFSVVGGSLKKKRKIEGKNVV